MAELTVVVFTKNEVENIKLLLPEIHKILQGMQIEYEIMLIDAWSVDGTVETARKLGARVITQSRPFYSSAIMDAFQNASGRYIITMDADGTHPAKFIPDLWRHREEADVVVASRYVPYGGSEQEWDRKLYSRILNLCYGLLLNVPVKDLSGNFRLYNIESIKTLDIQSRDIDVQEEILVKLCRQGKRIKEVPFIYKRRAFGRTKAKVIKYAISIVVSLIRLMLQKW